jgi:hypothetical protein
MAWLLLADLVVHAVRRRPLTGPGALWLRLPAGVLLVVGIAGASVSLGCASLEATWPTLNDPFQAFYGTSLWMSASKALVLAGFIGVCVVRLGSESRCPNDLESRA